MAGESLYVLLSRQYSPSDAARSSRISPAFNYPQAEAASMAPSLMSVRRVRPRHMTVLPGGGSLARAR